MHSKAERLATKSLLARKPKPHTLLDVSYISPKITAEYSNTINGYITALQRTHFELGKAMPPDTKRGAPITEHLNRLYAKGLAAPITRPGALTERSVTPIPGHESIIRPFPI